MLVRAADQDPSFVRFHDGLSDREADAVAAAFPGAGGIRPVEAVEQPVQVPLRLNRHAVSGLQPYPPAIGGEPDPYPAPVLRILDRVVSQNGDQFPDGRFVPVEREAGLDVQLVTDPSGFRQGPEGLRRLPRRVAEGKGGEGGRQAAPPPSEPRSADSLPIRPAVWSGGGCCRSTRFYRRSAPVRRCWRR